MYPQVTQFESNRLAAEITARDALLRRRRGRSTRLGAGSFWSILRKPRLAEPCIDC
jgi:hypothetical protein